MLLHGLICLVSKWSNVGKSGINDSLLSILMADCLFLATDNMAVETLQSKLSIETSEFNLLQQDICFLVRCLHQAASKVP
mmetsp:Transcript_19789/g.35951  ORF Transcript_19789/g.35951 Transcript_19789/m.35951 type:complete len:80 (-) Transcript_19789:569-808(-)